MLRGHATLIHLVGKRRKLHPSVFSFGADENVGNANDGWLLGSVDATDAERGSEAGGHGEEKKSGLKNSSLEWVPCPVCGKSITGSNSCINDHIDMCLVKGRRRKSTQLTLFSSMQRITKPLMPDVLGIDKELTGKRKLGLHDPGEVSLLKPKVSNLSGTSKGSSFQSDPLMSTQTCEYQKTDRCVSSVVVNGSTYVGSSKSVKEEINMYSESENVCLNGMSMATREDVTWCSYGYEGRDIQGHIKEETTSDKALGPYEAMVKLEDGGNSSNDIKLELHMDCVETSQDNVVLTTEIVCICNCHFATARSRCVDKQQVTQNACGWEDSKEVNVHEAASQLSKPVNGLDRVMVPEVVGVVDTFIVGRKFNLEGVCKDEMEVTFVRDPENPKDANAIKVLTMDRVTLGHLPRQVALALSPLLDKKLVDLKGSVLLVPEDIFEAVPIKLICKSKNYDDMDKETLTKGWHDVMEATLVPLLRQSSVVKYEANFLCLLQTVLDQDSNLFSDEERAFLSCFQALSGDAQRFFIHLYQRKGPWFRMKSLNYTDVADVELASAELIAASYMVACQDAADISDADLKEVVNVLNVFELRQILCSAQLKKKNEAATARKDELLDWVIVGALENDQISALGSCSGSVVKEMLLEAAGSCVRISDDALFFFWRVQRLFFLNGDQELSSFLLVNMGIVKYPQYQCNRQTPVFPSREALLEYEKALEVAQGLDMALEANNLPLVMGFLGRARSFLRTEHSNKGKGDMLANEVIGGSSTFRYRFTAARVYSTICTVGVSILEREQRYGEAVELLKELLSVRLQSGRRGYWTVRLAMDLDHLGRKEESLQVAEKGIDDPQIRGGDRVALQRRVVRLSKPPRRWRKPPYAEALEIKIEEVQIRGRPLNCEPGVRSRFYGYDGNQCGVEELALQYYASEDGGEWQGMHSEGGVWMTLFGLLMWEILFADVPDVFQTPFQTAPLDLDTQSFYTTRQPIIEVRLEAICQGEATNLLAENWTKYHGTYCRGVNWDKYSLEILQTIAACIGGPGLSAVCRLLAQDHAGYTAGMPDLLLWRTFKTQASSKTRSNTNCLKCSCGESDAAIEERGMEKYILQGQAKLVEVKGPRDRLSEQQRAWIVILLNAGLSVEEFNVCKKLGLDVEMVDLSKDPASGSVGTALRFPGAAQFNPINDVP